MRIISALLLAAVLFIGITIKADEGMYEHPISFVREFTLEGKALESEVAKGHSGKVYEYKIGDASTIITAEAMEKILKFRGYKDAKEFASAPLHSPMKDPQHALSYEYLIVSYKGRYTPPSDDQFYEKLAQQIAESEDSCPDARTIVDRESSAKMAARMADTQEHADHFATLLTGQLRKNESRIVLTKTVCDSDIPPDGSGFCYRMAKNGTQLSKFVMSPTENFGFKCKSRKAPPTVVTIPGKPAPAIEAAPAESMAK